jgi:hypothetical protein
MAPLRWAGIAPCRSAGIGRQLLKVSIELLQLKLGCRLGSGAASDTVLRLTLKSQSGLSINP